MGISCIIKNKECEMKIIALIPARLESQRLPQKLLRKLHGTSIITRTYQAVVNTQLFDDVIVVCDSELLKQEIEQHNGKAIRSKQIHECGSDRIAEVASSLNADLFINIQGDEPFIEKEILEKVIALLHQPHIQIASVMMPIQNKETAAKPNCVKVVVNKFQKALYFSRSPIPFDRDGNNNVTYYQHIGVYGFKRDALIQFTSLPPSNLEKIEKLENLRMLENGMDIYLDIVHSVGISIDTEEDVQRAEKWLDHLSP